MIFLYTASFFRKPVMKMYGSYEGNGNGKANSRSFRKQPLSVDGAWGDDEE